MSTVMQRFVENMVNRIRALRKNRGMPPPAVLTSKKLDSSDSSRPASDHDSQEDPRYDACVVLADRNIPYCIFCEDALAYHGVPTAVFDLYLLVHDVHLAGSELLAAGYSKQTEPSELVRVPEFSERYVLDSESIAASDEETQNLPQTGIVLLSASDWHYDLAESVEAMTEWFAPLAKALDSMMSRWADLTSVRLRGRLAILISYCYLYVEDVKTKDYAKNLDKENRQLHFDEVAETCTADLGTAKCQEHYRMVRDQIRRGEHDPTGPSGVELFPRRPAKWPVKMPIAGA
ncbi:Hypothetical predicted protein [Lecanosticta acicola]|uniref:Uncharacterized protein n=1 Tax=Lecanosticta acicola TaxID=111012 RepID=A0AAI9EDK1_9PEZI|nr:Hypothetical predicted protein [Lecanosticta acicola]